jgi:hypothetical protein
MQNLVFMSVGLDQFHQVSADTVVELPLFRTPSGAQARAPYITDFDASVKGGATIIDHVHGIAWINVCLSMVLLFAGCWY